MWQITFLVTNHLLFLAKTRLERKIQQQHLVGYNIIKERSELCLTKNSLKTSETKKKNDIKNSRSCELMCSFVVENNFTSHVVSFKTCALRSKFPGNFRRKYVLRRLCWCRLLSLLFSYYSHIKDLMIYVRHLNDL